MSTNANVFNSRVTSEALEAKFRQVFPAQAGAELIQDIYASGVIQPVIDFSSVAEGSVLGQNLQTAWDFSTSGVQVNASTATVISNTGFWQIDLNLFATVNATMSAAVQINDGSTTKPVWRWIGTNPTSTTVGSTAVQDKFVVFVRAGDTVQATSSAANVIMDVWTRQIADVNGNLVNPLGFTFS